MDTPLRDALQQDLRTAMRARDAAATRALRSALAAIANAEAVTPASTTALTEGPIAGAVSGVGAAEADRRELTDADIEAIVRAEIDERLTAAAEYDGYGADVRAADVRAEANVLRRHLAGPEPPAAP